MTDAWTQTMDPNAWICLHCGVRRIDGDFPDYVCKRAWNGVCEPRVPMPQSALPRSVWEFAAIWDLTWFIDRTYPNDEESAA